jgi:hypothetical protein
LESAFDFISAIIDSADNASLTARITAKYPRASAPNRN